jgi:hypothetical protein
MIDAALHVAGARDILFQKYSIDGTHKEKKISLSSDVETYELDILKKLDMLGDLQVVCDTNFLYRRYWSNLFKLLATARRSDGTKMKMMIPRLTVLELELASKRIDDAKKASVEKTWKQDASLAAFGELFRMLRSGAELLPPIDSSLLQSFTDKAGKKNTDAWIRYEIHKFTENYRVTGVGPPALLFVTSDLSNALAAISEGINTSYIGTEMIEGNIVVGYRQFVSFLVALSVFFGRMKILKESGWPDVKPEEFESTAFWEGKTIDDWAEDRLSFRL